MTDPSIEASRRRILAEIGDPPDLTFVQGEGQRGDELIWAGTRELLADHIYRTVELAGLCGVTGHTVLLSGGGAFCHPYHELMPLALAVAERRFERVIVLPSSFDPSHDLVREALARSRATVFAREPESFRRIAPLCQARLAHDCAFFFDYEPYRRPGRGTLQAFRTDQEALPGRRLPDGNDDITDTCSTLEGWLDAIAGHELVRTDRAHVMIAAAMLGKRVEFLPGTYHKVAAIAEFALGERDVVPLPAPALPPLPAPPAARSGPAQPRVTAVILTHGRPVQALRAMDSVVQDSHPVRVVVLDNNSARHDAELLLAGVRERSWAELHRSDRNLGCAGGRRRAAAEVDTEYILFLDDDAELQPGALGALLAELDEHPGTAAATATVLLPDGRVQHAGGWMRVSQSRVEFGPYDDSHPPPDGGGVDWVPGTAALIRRSVLDEHPIDPAMGAYFEDNEWCYRVESTRPGSFRRCAAARAVHHLTTQHRPGRDFTSRSHVVGLLASYARFLERHDRVMDVDLFDLVPGLRDEDGQPNLPEARLLLELVHAKGTTWTFMQWMNGGLDPVLRGERASALAEQVAGLEAAARERAAHLAAVAAESRARAVQIAELGSRLATQERQVAQQQRALADGESENARMRATLTWRLRARLLPTLVPYWAIRDRWRRWR